MCIAPTSSAEIAEVTDIPGNPPDFGGCRSATIAPPSCISRVRSYDIDAVSPWLPHPALLWGGLQARNVEEFNTLDAKRDNRRKEGRIVLVLVKVHRLSAGSINPDSG